MQIKLNGIELCMIIETVLLQLIVYINMHAYLKNLVKLSEIQIWNLKVSFSWRVISTKTCLLEIITSVKCYLQLQ